MKNSRLQSSQSLYLKQHQENPIDWWTWDEKAFQEAAKDKKVIFISIGYSSCHWCHVMGHESFSSEEVADYVNENFICIKVDREEHPEVDQYYQKMAQVMNRQGGWPLSVFLTHDKKPIFIGTYFPLKDTQNVPSFLNVCKEIIKYFAAKQSVILATAKDIQEQLEKIPLPKENVPFEGHFPSASSLLKALEAYADIQHGGYGKAPKFPQFAFFEAMIEQTLEGVVPKNYFDHLMLTMEKMSLGGVMDQARGGVHRYSTDALWLVPHFEKMLYDQAGLLRVLTKFSLLYPSPQIFDLLVMTLDYLSLEMIDETGYFFSAQDADSEGLEGLYFCFSELEFEDAISRFDENLIDDLPQLKKWFNISTQGNFENQLNIISLNFDFKNEFYQPDQWKKIRQVKQALLEERKKRIPPATDNKGIAAWNFMMLSSLCDVIQYCKIPAIKKSAQNILSRVQPQIEKTFILVNKEKKLFTIKHATTIESSVQYFEDYVFFLEAQWRLYQISSDQNFILNANSVKDFIIKYFVKDNICYTTKVDDSSLIQNIPYPNFDQSYRSALSTFYQMLVKIRLWQDVAVVSALEQSIYTHLRSWSLYNPLAHGEALRTLIYPAGAFKKIKVPKEWIENSEFTDLMTYFSHRFIFQYCVDIDASEPQWQICHFQGCEAMGKTFEEFKTSMTSNQNPSQ
jgi:uncharacterized protein YyaL (SSP411 family)